MTSLYLKLCGFVAGSSISTKISSAANSLHLRGKAMDFRIRGISAAELCAYVKQLPGVDEAYCIDNQFVHMGVEKY